MPFFEPAPEPEPEPSPTPAQYFTWPGQRPENWLPGSVSWSLVLARTQDTALALVGGAVYPQGIELTLVVRMRPGTEERHVASGGLRMHHDPVEGLRLGVAMPDGTKVLATAGLGRHPSPAEETRWHLQPMSGGGGGLTYEQDFWFWPLPDEGPLEFVCQWESRGVAESRAVFDVTGLVAAAAAAVELWPLPDLPPDGGSFGWHTYGPG